MAKLIDTEVFKKELSNRVAFIQSLDKGSVNEMLDILARHFEVMVSQLIDELPPAQSGGGAKYGE